MRDSRRYDVCTYSGFDGRKNNEKTMENLDFNFRQDDNGNAYFTSFTKLKNFYFLMVKMEMNVLGLFSNKGAKVKDFEG